MIMSPIALSVCLSSTVAAQVAQVPKSPQSVGKPSVKSSASSIGKENSRASHPPAPPVAPWKKQVADLLKQANEKTQTGEVGPARALVDQAISAVKENGADPDLLLADCLVADARIQVLERNMGLAEDSLKQSVDIRRKLLKPQDNLLIETVQEYAVLLDNMGRKGDADKLREEIAMTRAQERVAAVANARVTDSGDAIGAAIQLARQTTEKGDYDAALIQWKLALAAAQRQNSSGLRAAYCLIKLGDVYLYKKDYTQALHNMKLGVEAVKTTNPDSTCALMAFRRIGMIESMNKNYSQAIDAFAKASDICVKSHGDPRLAATSLQQGASMCIMAKENGKGEQLCKQLLEVSDQLTGAMKSTFKMTATSLLGSIYMQTGRMGEGMALMKQISQPAGGQDYAQQLTTDYTGMEKLADETMLKEATTAK